MTRPRTGRTSMALRRRGLFAAALAPWCALAPAAARAQAEASGPEAPAFPARFEAGTPLGREGAAKELTLADLAGRALVVCFWASWCPHCRAELAVLEHLQQKLSPEQLRVLLVNTEPAADWRQLRRRMQGQMKSLLTHDADRRVRQAFGAPDSVPFTTVVARDGRSQATLSGWSDDRVAWLIGHVNQALAAPRG